MEKEDGEFSIFAVRSAPFAFRSSESAPLPLLCLSSCVMERCGVMQVDPLLALGVTLSTAATDAVYVMFSAAVAARKRIPAASWSSVWYLLSAFAVISYTRNWVYVGFAALGSWVGAYLSMTWLRRPERE